MSQIDELIQAMALAVFGPDFSWVVTKDGNVIFYLGVHFIYDAEVKGFRLYMPRLWGVTEDRSLFAPQVVKGNAVIKKTTDIGSALRDYVETVIEPRAYRP